MKNGERLLIVDDETATVEALKDILERSGYEVLAAYNGKEAIESVSTNKPDLVLLDVMLPDIDGFEVCRRLKSDSLSRSIPILMVTALDGKEDRIKGLSAGADDFLIKPIEQDELLLRIQSYLQIKSHQERLLKNISQISESQSMKEDLMHMVVHDLNNPLFGLSLQLETLLFEKEGFSEKQVKRIKECINYSREIEVLVQNILDIYKMEVGHMTLSKQLTDMFEMIEEVLNLFLPRIESKKISLSINCDEKLPPVWVDRDLKKRVIGNLVGNAIRHTPVGGKIIIKARYRKGKKEIVVSVEDNGSGIKPEFHEKIFDKFQQLEVRKARSMSGLCGLGLPFCKMVVCAHQGLIWVESEGEGKGSRFNFTIPISGL